MNKLRRSVYDSRMMFLKPCIKINTPMNEEAKKNFKEEWEEMMKNPRHGDITPMPDYIHRCTPLNVCIGGTGRVSERIYK